MSWVPVGPPGAIWHARFDDFGARLASWYGFGKPLFVILVALCFSVTTFRRQVLYVFESNHEKLQANINVDCVSDIFRERERSQLFVV